MPARVRTVAESSPSDSLLPALAVAPGTQGGRARIAIAYYTLTCNGLVPCGIDAFLIRSPDGGRTLKVPERLSSESMRTPWLADTNLGVMLGDYISTSFAGGRPVPALAAAPAGSRFNQAIFAARLPS